MAKKDDAEQAKLDKEYKETGELPAGWVLDPVTESRGGPRWRKADAVTDPTATYDDPAGASTPTESEG